MSLFFVGSAEPVFTPFLQLCASVCPQLACFFPVISPCSSQERTCGDIRGSSSLLGIEQLLRRKLLSGCIGADLGRAGLYIPHLPAQLPPLFGNRHFGPMEKLEHTRLTVLMLARQQRRRLHRQATDDEVPPLCDQRRAGVASRAERGTRGCGVDVAGPKPGSGRPVKPPYRQL